MSTSLLKLPYSLNFINIAAIDIVIIIIIPTCKIGKLHEPFKELHEMNATKAINKTQNILVDIVIF